MCTLDEFDLTPKIENSGQTNCTCFPYDQCEWSKKVFNKMLKLGSRSALQLGYSRLDHFIISSVGRSFFQKRICPKERKVYCCNKNPRDYFDFPTMRQLKNDCSKVKDSKLSFTNTISK